MLTYAIYRMSKRKRGKDGYKWSWYPSFLLESYNNTCITYNQFL